MSYNYQSFYPINQQILPLPLNMQSHFANTNEFKTKCSAFTQEKSSIRSCNSKWQMHQALNEDLVKYQIISSSYPSYTTGVQMSACINSDWFALETPILMQASKPRAYTESQQANTNHAHISNQFRIFDVESYCFCDNQSSSYKDQSHHCVEQKFVASKTAETKLFESIYNDPFVVNRLDSPEDSAELKEISDSHKRHSNMAKSKINAKFLLNYRCKVEERRNSNGGLTTFYTCGYEGWNKEFTRTWSILDHVRMHEGVRPYVCKYCSRSYTQKGNMIKHMRRHIEPDVYTRRAYICEFCNHGYTEKYNLKVFVLLKFCAVCLKLQIESNKITKFAFYCA